MRYITMYVIVHVPVMVNHDVDMKYFVFKKSIKTKQKKQKNKKQQTVHLFTKCIQISHFMQVTYLIQHISSEANGTDRCQLCEWFVFMFMLQRS